MNSSLDSQLCLVLVAGLFAAALACLHTTQALPVLQLAQATSTERYLFANFSGALGQHFTALKIHDGSHERRLFIKTSLDELSSPGPPPPPPPPPATCTLGNDTFQVGARWNPVLPPFGVQVCVQCECIVRQRAFCYEPKVTCRRTYDDCPVVESCAAGKKPMTVPGQCCKMCPERIQHQQHATPANSTLMASKKAAYERAVKEYQTIMKAMPQCAPKDKEKSKEKEPEQAPKLSTAHSSDNNNVTSQPIHATQTTTNASFLAENQTIHSLNLEQTSLVSDADQKTIGQIMAKKNRSEILHFTLILID